ncbi:uncharacterized protein LOC111640858 [Centruroides sculpturatus]|uniref:uncharacterized protein LOC111640858 n=1 Tax=Centruroides sculpturatus TaxID=218467 RepID=UPI000C6E273F|nr:uncharacterized protein LOC111640858 [Centruroides sculpturatus]
MFSAAKEIIREEFSFLSKVPAIKRRKEIALQQIIEGLKINHAIEMNKKLLLKKLNNYPVLNKATSENETSISGYLYNEITGAHGPPDIIYGNEPYLLIRNTAKEVLDELYSETTFSNESLESKENKMVLSGYGSSASIGKMHGFGNTFQTSENVREKMAKGISSVMDKLLVEDKNPKLQNEFLTERFLQYQPVTIEHQGYENSVESVSSELKKEQQNTLTKPKIQRKHMPGKAGGGWDDDDYKENQDSKDIIAESNTSKDSLDRTEPLSQADCTEEQKVVDQFTHSSACFPPTFSEIVEARKQLVLFIYLIFSK